MKKVLNNIVYQAIYQLLQIILPIITVPVISNALGPKGLGIYNYTTSIVNYFVLFAGLGLSNYGVREIAQCRNNKKELSRKFFELEGMSLLVSILIFAVYFLCTVFLRYSDYYFIELLLVAGAVLDISWFYIGIEDFGKVSLSNAIIKIISFILIITLIHNYSDTKLYVLIQVSSTFLSQTILWIFLKGKINFVRVSISSMTKHIAPAAHYFISKIAISLYTTLNKTLLGILGTVAAVGYYSNAVTLYSMVVMVMTSVDEALLPRMSRLVGEGNGKKAINLMEKVVHLSLGITIPAMFGLMITSSKLVDWFFGPKFEILKILLPIVSPLVVIMPLGISIARQYLVPKGNIRGYNYSVISAGVISIVINILTIPKIGVYGAILATFVSETINTSIRIRELLKNTTFKFHYFIIVKYTMISVIMSLVIFLSTFNLASSVYTTLIQIIIGMCVYAILSVLVKTPLYSIVIRKNIDENIVKM
ncbi:flippase [Lactobacillus sp. UMNPBX10]|nr:flippase [Lactobacillus sp. UMNPBX10]